MIEEFRLKKQLRKTIKTPIFNFFIRIKKPIFFVFCVICDLYILKLFEVHESTQ